MRSLAFGQVFEMSNIAKGQNIYRKVSTLVILAALVQVMLAPLWPATARAGEEPQVSLQFECRDGIRFRVRYVGDSAVITTSAGEFVLTARRSSFGRSYASSSAAFIQDDERAALNGLPGGPFRRCRLLPP